VDQDLNGTLSSEEWEQFLRQMSHKVPSVLGRKLFLTLDRDRDGQFTISPRHHSDFEWLCWGDLFFPSADTT
jgi:hypothetical protein